MESRRQLRANETIQGSGMRLHVKLWNEHDSGENIPSPTVIQTSGGHPNGPQYNPKSTEWYQKQEKFARRNSYKLHREQLKDVHSQQQGLVPSDGSSQTGPVFSLAYSV